MTLNGEARPKKLCVKFQYHSDAVPFKLYLRMHQQHETLAFDEFIGKNVSLTAAPMVECTPTPDREISMNREIAREMRFA